MSEFLALFNANPPAHTNDILALERLFPASPPAEYLSFLRTADGGEGFIGWHYVNFWRASEIPQRNEDYKVREFAPDMLLIGSNGGGEAYAFDLRGNPPPIVRIPFITMDVRDAIPIARDFDRFLEVLFKDVD